MSSNTPIDVLAAASASAAEAFGQLRKAVADNGLDAATQELVVIGSLAARGQLPSLAVHTRRALAGGVDIEAIRASVVVTLAASTLFSEVVAALRTIDEVAAEAPEKTPAGATTAGTPFRHPSAPRREIGAPLSASHFAPGQPDAVVLLHSLALDRSIWYPLVDPLTTRLSVLACDLPGHGTSAPSATATIEAMADDVAATMDAAGLGSAKVVGLSLGGSIAQALTVRHPDKVTGLALLDTSCYYGPDAATAWAGRAGKARGEGLASLAQFQLERWFSDGFRECRPELCAAILELFSRTNLDGYAATCQAFGAMDLRDGITSISCPTVIVVGEHDYATPIEHAERAHTSIKGSTLHVLAGAKHLSAVERPAAVLGLIADLLGA